VSEELQHALVVLAFTLSNFLTWRMARRSERSAEREEPLDGHPPSAEHHIG